MMKQMPIAVLGAGSWGTALAILLARNGHETRLWGRTVEKMQVMQAQRSNPYYLPEIRFPDTLSVYTDLEKCLLDVEDIVIAVPSAAFKTMIQALKSETLSDRVHIISATKGLEPSTSCLLHDLVKKELGGQVVFCVLSGPSFAKEVARDLPTAVCLAGKDTVVLEKIAKRFQRPTFRVYKSSDIIGVQLGGVVKNVLAIAAGIADGLGFGANARAALITRGLVEMRRLGVALGGREQTFDGLAGLGDLILTCTDNQSRNRRFGLAVGEGMEIAAAEKHIGQVVEGKQNAFEVFQLAERMQVEMPITEQVYHIIYHGKPPRQAVETLLARTVKFE